MKRTLVYLLLPALIVAVNTGCETGGAHPPLNTTKYDLENKANFVDLDLAVQRSVTCTGIQERTLDDGRLELIANIRNREARRIQVQVNCVFKDALGFPTGDETPFENLILTENAQEGVHFVSMNTKAKRYTIRVREAH
ncbi:MAG: putative periplasmic lipoprotein [Limisphaerales bacterium]